MTRWKTKKERAAYYSRLLNEAELRAPLTEHYDDLMELLLDHPATDEKIGCGVASFKVDLVPPYFGRGFHILRTDGSVVDFSYRICLNGRPTISQMTTRAMRNEIHPQIDEFRRQTFSGRPATCSVTGVRITLDTAEIDHAPPHTFAKISASFLRAEELTKDDIETATHDGGVTFCFVDRELAARWQDHHQHLAVLRAVSSAGHKLAHANDNAKATRKAA